MSTDSPGASELATSASELVTPELAAALCKFQGEVETISKSATATVRGTSKGGKDYAYDYSYATLAGTLEAIRGPLSRNGFSVIQKPSVRSRDGGAQVLELETIVLHSSGGSIDSRLEFPIPSMDIQALGSAISYLRRYALTSILSLGTSDDDGAAAMPASKPPPSKPAKPSPKKAKKPAASSSKASASQLKLAWARARERAREFIAEGDSEAEKQLAEEILRGALPAGLESSKDLAARDVDSVLERIAAFVVGAENSEEPNGSG